MTSKIKQILKSKRKPKEKVNLLTENIQTN